MPKLKGLRDQLSLDMIPLKLAVKLHRPAKGESVLKRDSKRLHPSLYQVKMPAKVLRQGAKAHAGPGDTRT